MLLLLALVLHAHPLLAAGQPGQGLFFSTHAVRTRPLCKIEIPADLDSDGEDEVILLSDRRRGGDEVTFFQLLSQSGDFLAGPYRPGADIQDLRILNVDEDAAPEIVVCTENPCLLQVVQSGLDSAISHPLRPESGGAETVSVLGVLDADGSAPREILLAITPRDSSATTRLAAFRWADGRMAWTMELPGTLAGAAAWWGEDPQRPVVVPWSRDSGAGIWLIDHAGSLLRELHLAAEAAEVSAAVLEAPLGEPCLVALTRIGSGAALAAWVENGERPFATITIPGARSPLLPCAYRGAQHIAVATDAGDVMVLDRSLREVARFALPDRPASLIAAPDLDQNGSADLICRAGEGIACVRLPDGAVHAWNGATSAHVMRTGFGKNPYLVLRAGEQYAYYELAGTVWERQGRRMTWSVAVALGLALLAAGAVAGRIMRCVRLLGSQRRLLASCDAPAGVVRGGTLVWTNAHLLRHLQQPSLARARPLRSLLAAGGFSVGQGRTDRPDEPVCVVRGDRSFRLVTVPLCRDAILRPYRMVCMEEVTHRAAEGLRDAWVSAAGELTAQMRTCLSTIRLATQWVLGHAGQYDSRGRDRLELVLAEARALRSLADRLSEAAQLADTPRELVDLHDIVRETLAIREWGRSVTVQESGPAVIRANRRQIALALDVLLGALLGRPAEVQVHISVSSSRMDADDGNALSLTLQGAPRPGAAGSSVSLPRFAAALAEAVATSHGGAFRSTRTDGGLTVRLAFPRP